MVVYSRKLSEETGECSTKPIHPVGEVSFRIGWKNESRNTQCQWCNCKLLLPFCQLCSCDSTADQELSSRPDRKMWICAQFFKPKYSLEIYPFALFSEMSGLALSQGSLLNVFQGKRSYQPVWQVMKWVCVMLIRYSRVNLQTLFDWVLNIQVIYTYLPPGQNQSANYATGSQLLVSNLIFFFIFWIYFSCSSFRWVMVNIWRTMWPCILTAVWLSTKTHGKGRITGGVLRTSSHHIDFPP